MNAEIKQRWLDALRSGQYIQGREALKIPRTPDDPVTRHCCLGVLCELAKTDGIVIEKEREFVNEIAFGQPDGHFSSSVLPRAVLSWAGLDDDDPRVLNLGHSVTLSGLNDTGRTFTELADLIEQSL